MRNHLNENEFVLHENEPCRRKSFSYERFRTLTRFTTEVKGISEIAYWVEFFRGWENIFQSYGVAPKLEPGM